MSTTQTLQFHNYDAIVVGARVAGASTAMLLARRGLRVLLLDRAARPGTDTLSTHALMRSGVLQLARWGILPRLQEEGTPAIRRTIFHYPDRSDFVAFEPRDGVGALYAPRRTLLDAALVDAARKAGADVRFGATVTGLLHRGGRVTGVTARMADGEPLRATARWVVGADGMRSRVARAVGSRTTWRGAHSGAFIYGYWGRAPELGYEWFYRPGVTAGIIPTNDWAACVWVGAPTPWFAARGGKDLDLTYAELLDASGASERLDGAQRVGRLRGFGGVPGFVREPWGPGWALVGDASTFRDPISAHGMTDALRDAEFLAQAIDESLRVNGDAPLRTYARNRDACSLGLARVTDRLAAYDWDVPTVRELLRELSRQMRPEQRAIEAMDSAASTAA